MQARRWLRQNQVPFVERDVEASEANWRAYQAVNPAGGVPTLHVGDRILVGFDPAKTGQMLARAVVSDIRRARR